MATAKIESLTPEQEVLLADWHNRYLGWGLSTVPADRERAERAIADAYRRIGRDPVPVIWADSPLTASILIHFLGASLRDSLRASLWDSLEASLRDSLRASLEVSLRASLRDSLRDSRINPQYTYWWGQMDLYWVAYYRFCEELGVTYAPDAHDGLRIMDEIGRSCGWWYPRDGVCIACERPETIRMTGDFRQLHCADGPAVRFRDGWSLYYWHGVRVPEKLILHPDAYTRDDYLRETNAEIRRAAKEILGNRFAFLLDLVEIDRQKVGTGVHAKEATLLRTREPDEVAGRHIQYINVICHSTEREYMLCVPETITDAWEAVAWTFGLSKEQYDPLVEA